MFVNSHGFDHDGRANGKGVYWGIRVGHDGTWWAWEVEIDENSGYGLVSESSVCVTVKMCWSWVLWKPWRSYALLRHAAPREKGYPVRKMKTRMECSALSILVWEVEHVFDADSGSIRDAYRDGCAEVEEDVIRCVHVLMAQDTTRSLEKAGYRGFKRETVRAVRRAKL